MEESLQNRMYNYEIAPPLGSWEAISSALKTGRVVTIDQNTYPIHRFSKTMIAATILLFIIASVFFNLWPDGEAVSVSTPAEDHYSIIEPVEVNSVSQSKGKNTYVNVVGPHGKLRISAKVASIIISPNNSSKIEWNKKIAHWKDLMLTASNTDFMDVIPITQTAEVEN